MTDLIYCKLHYQAQTTAVKDQVIINASNSKAKAQGVLPPPLATLGNAIFWGGVGVKFAFDFFFSFKLFKPFLGVCLFGWLFLEVFHF